MKMKKHLLLVTILSLLSAAVLAGCGNTGNNDSSESAAESVQSSVSESTDNSTADESGSEANQNRNLTDQTEPKKPDPIEKMHGEWLDVLYEIGCGDSADYNASEEKKTLYNILDSYIDSTDSRYEQEKEKLDSAFEYAIQVSVGGIEDREYTFELREAYPGITYDQLKKIMISDKIYGHGFFGIGPKRTYRAAIIAGVLDEDATKLTFADAKRIVSEHEDMDDIFEEFSKIQKYPDYMGGSGYTTTIYRMKGLPRETITIAEFTPYVLYTKCDEYGNILEKQELYPGKS